MNSALPCALPFLTISDTRDEQSDKSGNLLVERLGEQGHTLHEKCILPDDIYRVRAQVAQWIADPQVQAVVSTGGTGLTGRDGTPEAVEPLFDKKIEGFGEVFRMISYEEIGTSTMQSRCIAGGVTAPIYSVCRALRVHVQRAGTGLSARSSTPLTSRATWLI